MPEPYDRDAVLKRADVVSKLPHVAKWIREFEALTKRMPPEVMVFAGSDAVVLALGEHNEVMESVFSGVLNNDAIIGTAGGRWDGGDA